MHALPQFPRVHPIARPLRAERGTQRHRASADARLLQRTFQRLRRGPAH